MENPEALSRILKEVDLATQAYEKAYSEAQQTSSLAQKELKARVEQAETKANAQAEQIWAAAQEKINQELASLNEKDETEDILTQANKKLNEVAQKLLLALMEG